jgi:hypothetical protein
VLSLNVTNGSADSCVIIIARQLEFFVVARQGGGLYRCSIVSARFGGISAWRVRSNSAVFYCSSLPAIKVAAMKTFLFFQKSA